MSLTSGSNRFRVRHRAMGILVTALAMSCGESTPPPEQPPVSEARSHVGSEGGTVALGEVLKYTP